MYDGEGILTQAIDQEQPFVFVAVNYRVAGWGFMPGKEILADGAANIGLLDQRMVRIFFLLFFSFSKFVGFADTD